MPKFYLQTLGCQMNKSDSERLLAFLEKFGYQETAKETAADLLIVNACSVRQSAIDRVHGRLRLWREWQKNGKPVKTILTGCVLPKDKEYFGQKFDLVLSIGNFVELASFLRSLTGKKIKIPLKEYDDYFKILPQHHSKFSAFVPIMSGCNHFCSYCAVPYARGREVSRSVKDVLLEIKNLARRGYVEITLLGQNVNNYQPDDFKSFFKKNPYHHPFAALLWEINQLPQIKRIFFTAPHPQNMTDEIIDALALPAMVNYLHLPVQSGDDAVLEKMNRHYTAADYLNLVKKIRQKCPDIALGTDIIVGFSGETKAAFNNTLKLYRAANFDIAFPARYSVRVGTLAAKKFKDDVSKEEKVRRWRALQNLMEKTTLKKNQKYNGEVVSVLVDSFKAGVCQGNSLEMKRVEFESSRNLIGRIVDIKIIKGLTWILKGKLIIKN